MDYYYYLGIFKFIKKELIDCMVQQNYKKNNVFI